MSHRLGAAFTVAQLLLVPQFGLAEGEVLTLDRALAIARERAPKIVSARARIEEARGRLVGASTLLRENPVLEGSAGPRDSGSDDSLDRAVGIRQTFEPLGRRRFRVASATSAVAHELATSDEVTRKALRSVAVAFLRVLQSAERRRLAASSENLASEVNRIAERSYGAEDVAVLDVNLARAALARSRSDVREAEAASETRLGRLRVLLGLAPTTSLTPSGDLRQRAPYELDRLLLAARERADLRELEAEIQQAEADLGEARTLRWPDVGLGARYEHEENADILLGEISLPLPIFDRGQGARAEADARLRRLRSELDAARLASEAEVRSAFEAYRRRTEAVSELETNALPLLEENERLSQRSYETGELKLAELLVIRREIVDLRQTYLDRLLDAAVAGIDLESSAGVLR